MASSTFLTSFSLRFSHRERKSRGFSLHLNGAAGFIIRALCKWSAPASPNRLINSSPDTLNVRTLLRWEP